MARGLVGGGYALLPTRREPLARDSAAISFLHRFGSALNHHAYLQACVTDGVFRPVTDKRAPRLHALGACTLHVWKTSIRWRSCAG